jgi:hypothetical protein
MGLAPLFFGKSLIYQRNWKARKIAGRRGARLKVFFPTTYPDRAALGYHHIASPTEGVF